jgi:hypothetical protein
MRDRVIPHRTDPFPPPPKREEAAPRRIVAALAACRRGRNVGALLRGGAGWTSSPRGRAGQSPWWRAVEGGRELGLLDTWQSGNLAPCCGRKSLIGGGLLRQREIANSLAQVGKLAPERPPGPDKAGQRPLTTNHSPLVGTIGNDPAGASRERTQPSSRMGFRPNDSLAARATLAGESASGHPAAPGPPDGNERGRRGRKQRDLV